MGRQRILRTMALLLSIPVLAGCGSSGVQSAMIGTPTLSLPASGQKPSQITMMVDGTVVTLENGRDEFEARWEALTGIDLVIIQPDLCCNGRCNLQICSQQFFGDCICRYTCDHQAGSA